MHYWLFDDFDYAGYLIRKQEGKPRFLLQKKEFLKFADSYRFYSELKDMSFFSNGTKGVGELLEKHGVAFANDEQFK